MSVAAIDNRIHVIGGEIPRLFEVHEVYDIAMNEWFCAPAIPRARHGAAAVAIDGGILVPGGGVIQGKQPTSRVDFFVPDEDMQPGNGNGNANGNNNANGNTNGNTNNNGNGNNGNGNNGNGNSGNGNSGGGRTLGLCGGVPTALVLPVFFLTLIRLCRPDRVNSGVGG
jgi:hypothetical protein